jgi:hypothetical protein
MRSTFWFAILALFAFHGFANAATIQATSFSSSHAGTTADPWPGSAIQSAIAAAQGGDVVLVANGIWSITSALGNVNEGFTLQGESTDAKLIFSGSGSWTLGASTAFINNVKISGLTFDGSAITGGTNPVAIQNCINCSFTGNLVIGSSNTALATLIFYGGSGNKISSNSVVAGGSASGGAQLQINAFAVSTPLPENNGYDIDGNYFDSVNLLVIGISNLHIHGNTLVNTTLGNYIAILFAAQYGGINPPVRNIEIDHNTVDAGAMNGAVISGVPQDPGGQGAIDGLVIADNVVKATIADIAVNTFDNSCFTTCTSIAQTSDVAIVNNFLTSYWTGSTIDLRGGTYGLVNNVTVQGNILSGATWVGPNVIQTDSNTSNMNKANNLPSTA